MAVLSEDDVRNIQHVAGLTEDRVPHTLDFSDDRQWSFFMRQVDDAGITAESHPQFYQSLLDSRERHVANGGPTATPEALYGASFAAGTGDQLQNANEITSLGVDVSQVASLASGFSSIVGGTINTFLSGYIYDPANPSQPLGSGQIGPIYGAGEYVPLMVSGTVPSGTALQFQFTYHYQVSGQLPVQQTVTLNILDQPIGGPTVTQPVYTTTSPPHPTFIKIGIGREQQFTPPDCNYWYNEPNINNPNIRCPAIGSQVFGSNILQPLFDGSSPTKNLVVAISMSQTAKGGTVPQVLPLLTASLQNYISAAGNTLSWSFPFNNNVQLDQSMQFGPAAWAEDTTLMLNFSLGVLTANSPTIASWVNITSLPAGPAGSPPSAGNWGTSPSAGQYIMWPIFYTWHCVAAGTRIRLADGSTAAVEDLTGGERVKNGPGDHTFTVVDTWRGTRETELVALQIEGADALLLTRGHPVMTPNGLVTAGELSAGSEVVTEQGMATLASVSTQPYSGAVYTFSVGISDEEVDQFTDDNTCVYANGILIADHRATIIHSREKRFGLDTVLSRIPPEFHDEARRWYPKQRLELEPVANLGLNR